MNDELLMLWLIVSLVWDVYVWGAVGYAVLWRGFSGWWFVLAFALTYNESMWKILRKRFEL